MSFFAPALYLVIALSILVLVHEWGHFIVARRTGVRVLKFSIGFGPEVVGVTRGETRWCLSAIPFGGYVKFAGDNPEESRDGASDEFLSQTVGVRSAIVLAGPVMNYVLAIALFAGVLYMAGEPVAHSTKIGEVVAGSVAESVGIQAGDVVRSVNGTHVEDWDSFTHELYRIGPAQDYKFEMDRKGQTVEIAGRTKADRGFGPDSRSASSTTVMPSSATSSGAIRRGRRGSAPGTASSSTTGARRIVGRTSRTTPRITRGRGSRSPGSGTAPRCAGRSSPSRAP